MEDANQYHMHTVSCSTMQNSSVDFYSSVLYVVLGNQCHALVENFYQRCQSVIEGSWGEAVIVTTS